MRLIHCRTLQLKNFAEPDVPPYAILSHTWDSQEVSAQELEQSRKSTRSKTGWNKIVRSCERAVNQHIDYLWIDTCCIDKTSSAELSEAINSMFRWYKSASVCYAYLSDVRSCAEPTQDLEDLLKNSRWFSRGWTLQELIAPIEIEFLSASWILIGLRSGLVRELSDITRVDQDVLLGERQLSDISIARRMSWYGNRETTRVEDIAYCLMGMFDVNMPMLYGEGEQAFIRLQEEIVKSSEDQSIFAWVEASARDSALRGLLAQHPRCFASTGHFNPTSVGSAEEDMIAVTNRGITLNVRQHQKPGSDLTAMFNCAEANSLERFAFIYLVPVDDGGLKFARIKASTLGRAARRGEVRPLIIKQKPRLITHSQPMSGQQWFHIKAVNLPYDKFDDYLCLVYFMVSRSSSIRRVNSRLGENGSTSDSAQIAKGAWAGSHLAKFLFQVPSSPMTVAVSLHISIRSPKNLTNSENCKINIGVTEDIALAVSTVSLGEFNGKASWKSSTTGCFWSPVLVPGTSNMVSNWSLFAVSTELSWEDVGDETVACIVVNVTRNAD